MTAIYIARTEDPESGAIGVIVCKAAEIGNTVVDLLTRHYEVRLTVLQFSEAPL